MSKVAVVFWSATGNTETMANCVAEGANGTIVPCSEMWWAGRGWNRCAVRSARRWAGWAGTRFCCICCTSR